MHTAKEIALTGLFTAVLLGAQFVLSQVVGVEVVTVLLLTFAYRFGARRAMIVANAFSLLRCFIYGFFPAVVILYLVYYNIFSLLFGLLGAKYTRKTDLRALITVTLLAAFMTVIFTLLDDIITPLFYGMSAGAARVYFLASLPVMVPQIICSVVTTLILFKPLVKAYAAYRI